MTYIHGIVNVKKKNHLLKAVKTNSRHFNRTLNAKYV